MGAQDELEEIQKRQGNGEVRPIPPAEVELARFSIVLKGNRDVTVENFPLNPAVGREMILCALYIMERRYREQEKPMIQVPGRG